MICTGEIIFKDTVFIYATVAEKKFELNSDNIIMCNFCVVVFVYEDPSSLKMIAYLSLVTDQNSRGV